MEELNGKEKRIQFDANGTVNEDGSFSVVMIDAGEGNGFWFSKYILQEYAVVFEDVDCMIDHSLWGHSVRDLCGTYADVQYEDSIEGITANLHPAGPSKAILAELGKTMLEEENTPNVGFSVDIILRVEQDEDGNHVKKNHFYVVEAILKCYSVDLVIGPARGGRFLKSLQSVQERWPEVKPEKEALTMKEEKKEKGMKQMELSLEDERQAIVRNQEAVERLMNIQSEKEALIEERDAARELRRAMCGNLLDTALTSAKLPEPARKRVRKQFVGRVFEPEELDEALADARSLVAEIQGESVIQGVPGGAGVQMFNSDDKIQAAVDDLLGAPREEGSESLEVARLSGIKEFYLMMTGDRNFYGGYYPSRVQLATTSEFSGLVTNSLNKAVADRWAEYGKAGYDWWKDIAVEEHFETLNDVTYVITGGIKSLPEISESGEYTELLVADSKETASFDKYGGYVPLTLELIDRDNHRKLAKYPGELAKAAIRNISEQVASIFTDNSGIGPTMNDTGALFNATAVTNAGGHANLLTTALSASEWETVAAAVYAQPMLVDGDQHLGTGKAQALDPKYCLVPRELQDTARDLFLNEWKVTDNKHAKNLLKGSVVPITVPEWTDANNWAAVCDPLLAPAIHVGERFGLMPEIFVAGGELAPAVFMNDEHRIKVRHFIAVGVSDYRPLHKSNVA